MLWKCKVLCLIHHMRFFFKNNYLPLLYDNLHTCTNTEINNLKASQKLHQFSPWVSANKNLWIIGKILQIVALKSAKI